jgi:predicted ArsR family transcriptional regulator
MTRPRNAMTRRRQQVLIIICETEGRVSLSEVARRCGLHSHRDARRIVRDLNKMGLMSFYPMPKPENRV